MILARAACADLAEDLELALIRLAMPASAREYLLEKLPQLQVLLSGLEKADGVFLKGLADRSTAVGREEFPFFTSGDFRKRPGVALLAGRRDQFERLVFLARSEEGRSGLADALAALLRSHQAPAALQLGERRFEFGTRTYVMGVVNVTPDSFSDGGRYFESEAAIAHGLALVEAGADILDIGGESTRPGSQPVSEAEERERVLPVLEGLRRRTAVTLSIDTTRSGVAEAAIRAGATLVNDISGFRFDPELPRVAARAGVACCVMHLKGVPATMQQAPRYEDLVAEVVEGLSQSIATGLAAGVGRDRLLVDPGIGFGKTAGHNLFLLRRLRDLRVLGLPILVGPSRKAFIGKLTGDKAAADRDAGTLGVLSALAMTAGADIVRVHDAGQARDALALAEAIRQARDGGELFASGQGGTFPGQE